MKTGRTTKRLLAAFTASALLAVDAHAASTDIFNQPLTSAATVSAKPNVMFILDNSGSMQNDYMPDEMDNTDEYGFKSSQCNGVAFDPNAPAGTYSPPLKADGSSYPNASFTAAASDGFDYVGSNTRASTTGLGVGTGSKTLTIPSAGSADYAAGNAVIITSTANHLVWMAGSVTGWNGTSKSLTVNVTDTSGTGSFASWDVGFGTNLNNGTYYVYTGTQPRMSWSYSSDGSVNQSTTFYKECRTQIGNSPGRQVFTLVTVTTGSSATLKQTYANWYSYYRTRRLMMRSAAGRAFSALGANYRVGLTTISDTGVVDGVNKFVDIGDFDATKKAAFYSSLYSATGDSYTPLRGALSKVGRYFAFKAPGQTSDPMQYSCQRNYAILSTDGYWNTGTETSTYGPYRLTSNSAVGQQDAAEKKPQHDGAASVQTTATPTTTVVRQQRVNTRTDSQSWQRWTYPVPATTGGGSCSATQYRIRVQGQLRTESIPKTITSIDDVTTVVTNTVVRTNGVITSNTSSTNTSTANVSSTTTAGASSFNAWSNSGGRTDYCVANLGALGMAPGQTYYSSTGCSGSCTYTNIGSGANGVVSGGVSTGSTVLGAPTTLATTGPTVGTPTVTNSTTGGSSNTLADVAQYYYITDLRQPALNNCKSGSTGNDVCANDTMAPLERDDATYQHMTTYTIGLGVNGTLPYQQNYLEAQTGTYVQLMNGALNWPVPVESTGGGDARQIDDLWHTAVNGRGRYFATNNATTLSNAVSGALMDAVKVTGSASGAATNSLEPVVGENNQAYIATYETISWIGDVQAYPLNASTGAIDMTTKSWSARAQLDGTAAGARKILYMQPLTRQLQPFDYNTLKGDGYGSHFSGLCSKAAVPTQCAKLDSTQTALANTGDNLVNFLRGDDTYEAATNLSNPLYRERESKLGDIINGSPVFVKKPPLRYTDAGYSTYVNANANRTAMLYVPANDGMLHALDATTGKEVWAFVPSFVMPNMYKLANSGYGNDHNYFVDGTPVVGDIKVGGSWKTILVGGLNSGGRGYYALDITDPSNPKGLWEFTDTNMGLTYGNPIITKRNDLAGTWVVAVTSGLNNTSTGSDGNGHLYLLDAATGAKLEDIATGSVGSVATPSGLARINAWVDDPTNNIAKRYYGGDMLGNLWRFDTEDLVAPSGKEATLLATFLVSGTPQPITTAPQVAEITQAGTKYALVLVGTGRYLGNADISDATPQSIYALKDTLMGTGLGDVRKSTSLVNQTVTVLSATTTSTGSSNAVDWGSKIGWKIDLPQAKERIVIDMALQFNTLVAASALPGASECNPGGGKSWLYAINIANGAAANPNGTIGRYLGDFLVVGMTWVKTASGESKIEIVGSDASVRTEGVPSPGEGKTQIRRSSWRELIN